MTPSEETQFIEKLSHQFILIPKNRLYYLFGGAIAFLFVAFGVSIGSVMAYLRTEPAEIARRRIVEIRGEVEQHSKDLGVGAFVRVGEPVALRSGTDASRLLNNHSKDGGTNMGGTVVNAQQAEPSSPNVQWTILRVNK